MSKNLEQVLAYMASNEVLLNKNVDLAEQLMYVLLVKKYSEVKRFNKNLNYSDIRLLFDEIKLKSKGVILEETIALKDSCLQFLAEKLFAKSISLAGDSYEYLYQQIIGYTHKSGCGQFFTPLKIVDLMIELVGVKKHTVVADISCGTGIFLRRLVQKENTVKIIGIEKDSLVCKMAATTLGIEFAGDNVISNKDSLIDKTLCEQIPSEGVDYIFANPPFGLEIDIRECWFWKKQVSYKKCMIKSEVAFLIANMHILKKNGKMAIVLPDGILGNRKYSELREWLINQGKILAIISLPKEAFRPYTSVKTSILIYQKSECVDKAYNIFMAISDNCGKDNKGEYIKGCDFDEIIEKYKVWESEQKK